MLPKFCVALILFVSVIKPTVLTNVTRGSASSCEETFRLVITVMELNTKMKPLPLQIMLSVVFSDAVVTCYFAKGFTLADRIESGIVHIND
jgi:acyl-CoA reductase-like NAD-dependent aldehyde dehydrogenase